MRAFLALPIPDGTVAALIRVQSRLPVGRPVPEDNLHLTLVFLGDMDPRALEDLHGEIETLPLPAPQIRFGGLGTFAEMERGLTFAEVLPDEDHSRLQAKLATVARSVGADLPRRRFRPHVTLMRSNRQPKGPARDLMAGALGMPCDIPGFQADRLCLYRSELHANGARHDVLAEYPLLASGVP